MLVRKKSCTPILYCKKWDGSHWRHKKVHDFRGGRVVRGKSGVRRENLLNNVRPEVVQRPKSMPQTLKLNGPAPQFHKEINPLSGQTGDYFPWNLASMVLME